MDDGEGQAAGLFPQGVGEQLRVLREKSRLDLNDVATKTRIPLRHLHAIERGEWAALPSPTYAIGFVKAYCRVVGGDENVMADGVRAELGRAPVNKAESASYQPIDPARVPTRLMAWTALILALIVGGGWWAYRTMALNPTIETVAPAEAPIVLADANIKTAPTTPNPAPSATGQVVLTATAPVWLRISGANKTKLLEKQMVAGERYEVPGNAVTPVILTGRPDALAVTIDGKPVPPLGKPQQTIRDVGVSAAALAARDIPASNSVATP